MEQQQSWYLRQFESFERSLNGESTSPLHSMRRTAMAHFTSHGFPTTREEEWRFTNIQPIAAGSFIPAVEPQKFQLTKNDIDRLAAPSANRIVFVNGHVAPELSSTRLPKGSFAGGLALAQKSNASVIDRYLGASVRGTESAFTALNTSFIRDGAFVHIPAGAQIEEPIVLVFVASSVDDALAIQPRNLFVLGEGSSATIVEYYVSHGASKYMTNAVTEVDLSVGARLDHQKVQLEARNAYHIGIIQIRQHAKSIFHSTNVALGGAIVRNELTSVLSGERCECTLNGLSVGAGTQVIDNHTTIDHAMPNCNSWEVYKAILDGKSRGVFNGKIFVRKDAQKTDAKQTNKTLLLSDEATIDTKPQLEIFADDVKCTHGATVGQLDEQQIFYLRTRGIGIEQARDMLTVAFALDVLEQTNNSEVREHLKHLVQVRLDEGKGTHAA